MNKFKLIKILSVVFLIGGILLLFYPAMNNVIFMAQQNKVIEDYNAQVEQLDEDSIEKIREEAQEYNSNLSDNALNIETSQPDPDAVNGNMSYRELLSMNNEQMGYIVIPKIKLNQPIFHSTTDEILEIGIGHLENSSLPVGGKSTHCVLTGHSAIPGMMLFTDLEDMVLGDKFYIKILDEVLAYEIDQIKVIEPTDTSDLQIVENEDYVTLLTCTPYGVNTHRLIVRGTRVEYNGEIDETEPVSADANADSTSDENITKQDDSKFSFKFKLYYVIIPSIIAVILIILFVIAYKNRRKIKEKLFRKREKNDEA